MRVWLLILGVLTLAILLEALTVPEEGLVGEDWMEAYWGDDKIGYSHGRITREGTEITVSSKMVLTFKRGPASVTITTESTTVENLSGGPVRFETELLASAVPLRQSGVFREGAWEVVSGQGATQRTQRYPMTADVLMPYAASQQLLEAGLDPGTVVQQKVFSPDVSVEKPVPMVHEVMGREVIRLGGEDVRAARVVSRLELVGTSFETETWYANDGTPLQSVFEIMGQRIRLVQSTAEQALGAFLPADLFTTQLLDLGRPLPLDAEAVTFTITFPRERLGDEEIPQSWVQEVLGDDGSTLRVRVQRFDAEAFRRSPAREEALDLAPYIEAGLVIASDDPKVQALAREAAKGSESGLERAEALRAFVEAYITETNLEVAFANAAEVARERAGDCTEHAVLLTAMARAQQIPARVVVGLAYLPRFGNRSNVLGFHMWTQVRLRGRWVDLDPTLEGMAQAPVRIGLFASALKEDSQAQMSLQMVEILQALEVELTEIER